METLNVMNPTREHVNPLPNPSPGVYLSEDGVMRWTYEMSMWKNPTVFISIWKVLLLAALAPSMLNFYIGLEEGIGAALLTGIKIYGITAAIITGLILLAYPLVALIFGGKYSVLFEMDDQCIKHIQMQKQFRKSQVLALITTLTGVATGNVQTASAGILAGSKQITVSQFTKVKKIIVNERWQVIFVNEAFSRNQIYADPADFGFIKETLINRCPNAVVIYK
jgi:hypothetical protein